MSDRPRVAGVLLDDVTMIMVAMRGMLGEWGVEPDSTFDGDHVFDQGNVVLTYSQFRYAETLRCIRQELIGRDWMVVLELQKGLIEFDPDDVTCLRWNKDRAVVIREILFNGSEEAFVRDMTLAKLFYL